MTESLQKIYDRNRRGDWPDKGTVHSYIEVYEAILRPYKYTAKNILEIGLMSGESLRMWNEYFAGDVYGIDCAVKPLNGQADLTEAIKDGYNIVIGDATNHSDIEKHFRNKKFDVVIEDANHDIDQQIQIYSVLRPYMNHGSIYIIEDIQDINRSWEILKDIDPKKRVEVIDCRHIKNRYDDVLIVIK